MLNAQVIMNPLLELSVGMDLSSGAGGRRKIVCVHNCDVRLQFTWSPGRVRRICNYLFWESRQMRSHALRSPIASMITGLRIVNQTAAFMATGPWVTINLTQAATGSTAPR